MEAAEYRVESPDPHMPEHDLAVIPPQENMEGFAEY